MSFYSRYSTAVQDFRRARRRAALQEFLQGLGGRSSRLLSYDEVRKKLGRGSLLPRGLREVPLDAIVGTVGRYEDFNRQFLPRQASQQSRWAQVRLAVEGSGLPPVELYQIGDAYFVLDGHHRVSVARELGATTIEAYVSELPSRVKLGADAKPNDLILKAEEALFLEETRLDELHPELDLRVTLAGRYNELLEHIRVHRYYMGLDQKRSKVSQPEAVEHWLQTLYLPAVAAIRRLDLLHDFPGRTEADMYLWLMKRRHELQEQLGWDLGTEETAAHLWNRLQTAPRRWWDGLLRRLGRRPPPTQWRLDRGQIPPGQKLFPRILVPISGEDASWTAVDLAIRVAHKEAAELRGVHVLASRTSREDGKVEQIRAEFQRRLDKAGVRGRLVLEQGNISRRVEARSHWSDLVVLHLKHPPAAQPLPRLFSGLRVFLSRSPRPALVVRKASRLRHALLAYDGSSKANEALYLAAYLANAWGVRITVFSSRERRLTEALNLQKAKGYLISQGVEAQYLSASGAAAPGLLEAAREQRCDFMLIGGYGRGNLLEMVWGSTLDQVLREFKGPVWVCC